MLKISATPSVMRNWQTNLSLLTSQGWKLLSMRPSNSLMPLKKDMKRNKRRFKGLPSMPCLLHLVSIFTYPFFFFYDGTPDGISSSAPGGFPSGAPSAFSDASVQASDSTMLVVLLAIVNY